MGLDDAGHDRQAQPRPRYESRRGVGRTVERLEDVPERRLGDPDAGVGDPQHARAVLDGALDPDLPAVRGELDRVRDQVDEDPLQLGLLAPGDARSLVADHQSEVAPLQRLLGELEGTGDRVPEVDGGTLDEHRTSLDPAQHQEVLDHREQAPPVAIEPGQQMPLPRGQRVASR